MSLNFCEVMNRLDLTPEARLAFWRSYPELDVAEVFLKRMLAEQTASREARNIARTSRRIAKLRGRALVLEKQGLPKKIAAEESA